MARGYRGRKPRKQPSDDAVVVDANSERWLSRGFCWVYPAEVESKPAGVRPGQAVKIRARDGRSLGAGLWDDGWIAVRRLREDDGPIDAALIRGLVEQARALREAALPPDTTAYRLINAENDGLPGVRVDVYGWYLVVSLDAPGLLAILDDLVDVLQALLEPRGVYLAWRPDHRDSFDPEAAPRQGGLIAGRAAPGSVRVTERGVACLVTPGDTKDVGVYPDMRDNRAWLEPHWGGRRVLNLFAHTGMFSVVAALGGASEVVTVDLSPAYLDRAEANFVANDLSPEDHTFIAGDARKVLDRLRRTGERFDIALLDPPAFSHGPAGAFSAKQHYPALVAGMCRVLAPGGWLVCALNLGEISPRDFHKAVRDGARKADARLQLLHEGSQPPDFPAAADFPEGRYLKFGVWRVLDGL
jgi:23S rRNA (cytosine1962-C5)-methyltransferase